MALMLVSCLLAGCRNTRVEIPKPTDVLEPPPSAPSVEQSVVHLKVSVPVNELAIAADAALPTEAGHEETWLNGGRLPFPASLQYQYRIVRGPLQWRMTQDRLETHVPDILYRITGKPIFDEATQTLSFQQLAFTVDTKNVLVRMADRLFYNDLLVRLEPRTRIDLSITSRRSAGSSQGT